MININDNLPKQKLSPQDCLDLPSPQPWRAELLAADLTGARLPEGWNLTPMAALPEKRVIKARWPGPGARGLTGRARRVPPAVSVQGGFPPPPTLSFPFYLPGPLGRRGSFLS